MICVQALVSILIGAIAVVCFLIHDAASAASSLTTISVLFIALAFLAATNDVAIDGYYMEGLTDPGEQAAYTGYRVFAYRMAVILVRSGFVALAAWAAARTGGMEKYQPWAFAFGAAALTMLITTLFHIWKLPQFEQKRSGAGRSIHTVFSDFGQAFISYSRQQRFVLVLVFIVFYKVGDEILFSMVTPFLMRELGVTKAQFAWLGGFVGAFGAIVGTSIGGIWIKRKGLKKTIWPLTLLMNLNIWAYIWLAYIKPSSKTLNGVITIAIVHGYEQIAAGLGSAALTVFILRTCKPEYKASHYAVGTAIMSLFATFFGGFGGVIVEKMGYLNMFIMAFFATLPSMLLLFWVPIKGEKEIAHN
jgi:PAT family beta-lactamase induction signal transducer AmpG